jgi:isopenicillin-N N-acyltransferase like protein
MIHTFTGDGYARGTQHGSLLREDIRRRLAHALPGAVGADDRARIARPWIAAIRELDAELIAELTGIADGADVSVVDVVLLNSFEAFDLADMVERGGCTVVGIGVDGRAILAQNWDANAQLAVGLSVHRHLSPDGTDVAVLASPGGLGWIGMNAHGLGLVNNDLLGGPTAPTASSQAIRRFLLKSADTASAVDAARSIGHPALRSYVLADAAGAIAGLEAMPDRPPALVADADADAVVHANHAVTEPARRMEDGGLQRAVYPSSAHRAQRARDLLGETRSDPDPRSRALEVLRDHDGLPLSICRHASTDEPTTTVATVVFDCAARRAEFFLGLACTPESRDVVDFTAVTPAPIATHAPHDRNEGAHTRE